MVRLRLRRMGKKKQPSYRLVATDKQAPRDGRFIEALGYYNPCTEPITLKFNEDKVLGWLQKGAQPSDTVHKLLKKTGIWDKFEQSRTKADTAEAAK